MHLSILSRVKTRPNLIEGLAAVDFTQVPCRVDVVQATPLSCAEEPPGQTAGVTLCISVAHLAHVGAGKAVAGVVQESIWAGSRLKGGSL